MHPEALAAGVVRHDVDGTPVPVFDPSKTIADLFRFRSRVGLDVALEALRAYAGSAHRDLEALRRNARIDGVARLLMRIARSPHADRFVLKGAQRLLVHAAAVYRPTRDLDVLGFGSDDADDLVRVFREICGTTVEPDGLWFDASSVTGEAIRETATYGVGAGRGVVGG